MTYEEKRWMKENGERWRSARRSNRTGDTSRRRKQLKMELALTVVAVILSIISMVENIIF